MDEIEEQHVLDAYPVWVEKTSFSTANKVLSLLSSFWDWCESYKYLPRDSNPCKYVRKGKTQTVCKKTTLDIDGYKGLFAALERGPIETDMHEKYFRIIKLLALTGCRSSEIRCLKVREVDLEHKVLHLEDSKTGARDVKLPDLSNVKELEANEVLKEQHFTKPPARYTEAKLIKEMEELGIGRPSTYAKTMDTIKTRGYVKIEEKKFIPTEIGIETTDKLQEFFKDLINIKSNAIDFGFCSSK